MFNHRVVATAPEKVLKVQTNATEYTISLMMIKTTYNFVDVIYLWWSVTTDDVMETVPIRAVLEFVREGVVGWWSISLCSYRVHGANLSQVNL